MKRIVITILLLAIFYFITNANAESNLMDLPDTLHYYTTIFNGAYLTNNGQTGYDSDFSTSYGYENIEGKDPPQIREATVTMEHVFSKPYTISKIKYRLWYYSEMHGHYIQNHRVRAYLEYFDGSWKQLPNSYYYGAGGEGEHGGDTGVVVFENTLSNVTKVRVYINSWTQGSGGEALSKIKALIYELQAFAVTDIGLRAFDGSQIIKIACEPWGGANSPLKINKNGTTYSVALVATSDPNASKFRIMTPSGVKALRKL